MDDGQAVRNLINDLNDLGDAAQNAADDIGEIAQATKGAALMEAADQLSVVGNNKSVSFSRLQTYYTRRYSVVFLDCMCNKSRYLRV